MLVLLALAVGLCPACKQAPCRDGTLFVSLSFAGAARDADGLDVAVAIDGGSAQHRRVSRAPGAADSIALPFTRYPAGSMLTLTVVALQGTAQVANAVDVFSAPPGCAARNLTLGCNTVDGGGAICDGAPHQL